MEPVLIHLPWKHFLLSQALQRGSEGVPQFRIGERACSGQFPIEQIDLTLLSTQLPIFSGELLLHLFQTPT